MPFHICPNPLNVQHQERTRRQTMDFWIIMMCQSSFINCKKCTILAEEGDYAWVEQNSWNSIVSTQPAGDLKLTNNTYLKQTKALGARMALHRHKEKGVYF